MSACRTVVVPGVSLATMAWASALALILACGAPPPGPATPAPVTEARLAMGTELRLTAWTSDEAAALDAFDAVYA